MKKEELVEFLGSIFDQSDIDIEDLPGDRFFGTVIWKGFAGKSFEDRQRETWTELRSKFGANVQSVGVLYLFTPSEYEDIPA